MGYLWEQLQTAAIQEKKAVLDNVCQTFMIRHSSTLGKFCHFHGSRVLDMAVFMPTIHILPLHLIPTIQFLWVSIKAEGSWYVFSGSQGTTAHASAECQASQRLT